MSRKTQTEIDWNSSSMDRSVSAWFSWIVCSPAAPSEGALSWNPWGEWPQGTTTVHSSSWVQPWVIPALRSDKRMKKSAGDSDFQLFKSLQSFSFSRLSFQIQWSRDKLSIDTMCVSTLKCLPTDSMSIIKSRRFYALNFSWLYSSRKVNTADHKQGSWSHPVLATGWYRREATSGRILQTKQNTAAYPGQDNLR